MNSQIMELVHVLEKTVSDDKNELVWAKTYLERSAEANFPEFLRALSDILVTIPNSLISRMAAGLQLKNQLTSKDEMIKLHFQRRWLSIPDTIREYIKQNILTALGTEGTRPSCAAQCVAYVAVAELPTNRWVVVIPALVNKVIAENSSDTQREAALEAIGYICQDIRHGVLEHQSNQILSAILHGVRIDQPSNHVRLAATNALINSLEFTRASFANDLERNTVMDAVCFATQSPEPLIAVAGLQCLVKILSLYYQYMEPYMIPALFPITLAAVKSDNFQISLQGIEFWSNVCDEEIELREIAKKRVGVVGAGNRVSKRYTLVALKYLAPLLIEKLSKQDETEEDDRWNPARAASVCLSLLSNCCEDDIVPYVFPFINTHIESINWRFRDAGILTFGSILGGLKKPTVQQLANQSLPIVMRFMYDHSGIVRATTAWTLGRICNLAPDAVIDERCLGGILDCFITGLKSEPRVAANVCWGFIGLSDAAYNAARSNDSNAIPQTYVLSPYYENIIANLISTSERKDVTEANLRAATYEALMQMLKNSPLDCYVVVRRTTFLIIDRINHVFQMDSFIATTKHRYEFTDLQSLLCATLQSVMRRVREEDGSQIADSIMSALFNMFQSNAGKSSSLQENIFLVVSTLVETLGFKFINYVEAFKPFLFGGVQNHREYQTCCAAVGLAGDICRALRQLAVPYCNDILHLFIANLAEPSLHRSIKPLILSAMGDMALSIGNDFIRYMSIVLGILRAASQVQIDSNNYEMVDYLNELRESILDGYTGVIQGLKCFDQDLNAAICQVEPYLIDIFAFIKRVAIDPHTTETMAAAVAGLLGDLSYAFGRGLCPFLGDTIIFKFLIERKRSAAPRTKSLCGWALRQLRKLRDNRMYMN